MSTDVFERYAALDPANSPLAAPDWASMAPVSLAAIDERTTLMQTQTRTPKSKTPKAPAPTPTPRRNRTGLLVAAAVFAVILVTSAVLAVISMQGEPEPAAPAPEDVIAQVIEAANARDLDALAELYHPDMVHTYDASSIGGEVYNREVVGREAVLENMELAWLGFAPVTVDYEIREVNGQVVITDETIRMGDGSGWGYRATWEISEDGRILREDRVVIGRRFQN